MKTAFAVSWMLLLLAQEAAAHMALLYPMPRGGVATKQYDGEVHTWIGFNDKRILPCNGYGPGPVTALKAGQVVNVSLDFSSFLFNGSNGALSSRLLL